MKMLNMFVALAILAVSSVALANNYSDDVAPPSGFANFQEDVVVGEELPAESVAPEAYEGVPVESYGYAPTNSWSSGCCGESYGGHSHLWDNYCAEKHCGWGGFCGRGCCGKAFSGCGMFRKGCCEPKCGKCRKFCLPKLHMPKLCCETKSFKGCSPFAKSCCEPKCGKCRKLHLPKLRLFSRKGCCNKGCGKTEVYYGGDEVGEVIYEGQPDVNEIPTPAPMEMPNEVPVPPMVDAAA
jgi:hypothetical protein